jgi:hypothetical protein
MDLEAIEEIKQLKYRYLRTLDLKRWDEFAAVFVPDATGKYGEGLTFANREELVGYMRENLLPSMVTMHHCHHPEIAVDGDTATGTWYLEDRVIAPEHRFVLEGAAFYSDRYVRTGEGWRISHTGYLRTFEATWSMNAVVGYQLKLGNAYESADDHVSEEG